MHGLLLLFWLCNPHMHFVVQKYPSHVTQALTWLSVHLKEGQLQWFRQATFYLGLTLEVKESLFGP